MHRAYRLVLTVTVLLIRTRGSQRADPAEGLIESPACDPNDHYRDLFERGLLEDTFYKQQ